MSTNVSYNPNAVAWDNIHLASKPVPLHELELGDWRVNDRAPRRPMERLVTVKPSQLIVPFSGISAWSDTKEIMGALYARKEQWDLPKWEGLLRSKISRRLVPPIEIRELVDGKVELVVGLGRAYAAHRVGDVPIFAWCRKQLDLGGSTGIVDMNAEDAATITAAAG